MNVKKIPCVQYIACTNRLANFFLVYFLRENLTTSDHFCWQRIHIIENQSTISIPFFPVLLKICLLEKQKNIPCHDFV